MKASEAIVAQAPLVAGGNGYQHCISLVCGFVKALTCCDWMMSGGIAAHSLLNDFVCCKVNRMCRSCPKNQLSIPFRPRWHAKLIPAPNTTLDSPRHNDMYPSTREMVAIALPMPVYMAAGVGLTTCMRVYDACQQSRLFLGSATSTAYLEQVDGIHDRVFLAQYQSPASPSPRSVCALTAMPAKAPATILAASEKLGGSPS